MKAVRLAMAAILLAALAVPSTQAAVQLSQQFSCPYGEVLSVQNPGLLGVLNSGQTVLCITLPSHVARIGDTASLTITAVGPTLLSIAAVGEAGALLGSGTGLTGCTFAGVVLGGFASAPQTAPAASGQDASFAAIGGDVVNDQWGTFTITGPSCSGLVRAYACISNVAITACNTATYVYNIVIAVNISTDDSRSQVMVSNCGNTGAGESSLTQSTTCGAETINSVVSGSLTLSGSLGVVNSGTQHLVVDSWPSLVAAVTNSGTLNVVNSGGQSMAVSGSLAVSGALTVTNAGGQSLTVTSWPQLQAVLSGAVTVHQDPICTASSHCFQDISGLTINQTMGNVSVVIPSETTTHLCGPVTNTSACSPVVAASTVSSVEAAHWLPIIAILAVLLAGIFWANPLLITLGIIGFPVYFATMSPVKELGWLAMIMLSILVPAIARFYANYKARMERGAPI